MKVRNLLVVLITVILAWLLPTVYNLFTGEASGRLLVYFSSINQHFCVIEKDQSTDNIIRKDLQTKETYSINQFDSILPLLYYRQLLADGKMPEEIHGKKILPKEANEKSFFFRYKPKEKNSPTIDLFPLFESVSGRVDLKMPEDVFRLKKTIAFILPESNTINEEKTARFRKVFEDNAFMFPVKIVAGNPSSHKPYDEGYFLVDANQELYHFKMVKEEPFLKRITLPNDCKPQFFAPYEPDDRSFYGFLFDEKGAVYVVNTNNYQFQKLDCGNVSLEDNYLMVMGNPLYWTVRVLSKEREDVFAFDAETKHKVAEYHFQEEQKTDEWNKYIFPIELQWSNPFSRYVLPKFSWGYPEVFVLNIFFALLYFFVARRKATPKAKLPDTLWILVTGIFGLVAVSSLYEKELI